MGVKQRLKRFVGIWIDLFARHKLLDHAAATEERFNRLVALLQHEGMDCREAKEVADAFDPRQINKMLE